MLPFKIPYLSMNLLEYNVNRMNIKGTGYFPSPVTPLAVSPISVTRVQWITTNYRETRLDSYGRIVSLLPTDIRADL